MTTVWQYESFSYKTGFWNCKPKLKTLNTFLNMEIIEFVCLGNIIPLICLIGIGLLIPLIIPHY